MKLEQYKPQEEEATVALKNTKAGDCIRFATDSIEECFKSDLFWMRIDAPEVKGRVRLVNLSDGKQIERDDFHRVVTQSVTLQVVV